MTDHLSNDISWIARRHGHDWRDDDALAAIDWLVSFVPKAKWEAREAAVDAHFQAAKTNWAEGRRVPLFEPTDAVAWYVYQARRYADPRLRSNFFLPRGYRIAPLFTRIGQLLPMLRTIEGAETRAAKLMVENNAQPDDGIFELLVAGAYARRGWKTVRFVPEAPGVERRHDLLVDRPRSTWAVECKRAGRSGYAQEERLAGERMADCAHALSRRGSRSLVILVNFTRELHLLGNEYLAEKVEHFLSGSGILNWKDEGGEGIIADVHWDKLHNVMKYDDLYFGSTRMLELIIGWYDPKMDFSIDGVWTPSKGRPLYATWVDHVSLVIWRSTSDAAARRKARHFRSLVAWGSKQLPGDCPGVIHVGYEAVGGNSEDSRRHYLNASEMRTFDPEATRLRTVYGNYFMHELVTARNESAAVTETLACYPVGTARPLQPLPRHMLFSDNDGEPGSHL